MRKRLIIENGQRYYVYRCPNCGNHIKIRIDSNERARLMGKCPQCSLRFETTVGPF